MAEVADLVGIESPKLFDDGVNERYLPWSEKVEARFTQIYGAMLGVPAYQLDGLYCQIPGTNHFSPYGDKPLGNGSVPFPLVLESGDWSAKSGEGQKVREVENFVELRGPEFWVRSAFLAHVQK
jgi:hypothetical protein